MNRSSTRVLVRIFLIGLLLWTFPVLARPQSAAIVMEYETGRVLYADRPDTRIYPASMTKMMTLYLTFDALSRGRLRLDSTIRISRRAAGMPPSRLGLRPGERIRVRNAILALVTKSANDVAVALAERLAGSESAFARRMTRTARKLGMRRTTFRNASGLPNRRQRTTVRDMALLARALIHDFPRYYRYFSQRKFRWRGRTYHNHNRLLGRYPGMDGLKTGYIRASGFNLAASAKRNGRRLIAVVAGGRTATARNRRMVRLLDLGFERLQRTVRVAEVTPPRPRPRPAAAASVVRLTGIESDEAAYPLPRMRRVASRSPSLRRRSGGSYGIQVGAYLRRQQAQRIAYRAQKLVPDLLITADVEVSRRRGKRRTFYRARIVGLSSGDARQACRVLARRQMDCMVFTLDRPIRVAAR